MLVKLQMMTLTSMTLNFKHTWIAKVRHTDI